jgi:branched-chain amino acid transport system ATP-binding protein
MSTILQVEGLHAGYGRTVVVRDLFLDVAAGEVVALLGPNGAGKTTTLSTIAGLLPPIGGDVRVLGEPVDHRAPHRNARQGVALVTEERSLFPGLTVAEHLRLAAGNSAALATRWFPALAPLMGRRAGLLSGGEQQMLALARALAARPRLLLVDEMSLGLAPVIVADLATVVRSVADDGVAVVLVEQHVPVALKIADRAVVLRHGNTVFAGPAAELGDRHDVLVGSYL